MNRLIIFTAATFCLLLSFSCNEDSKPEPPEVLSNYLHISHTRKNTNPAMDSVVESLDYSKYDMLWLGGDLASSTSSNDETMTHVDSIFNISDKNTLWSLGNHDYSDLERVEQFTNRPPYYAFNKNNITVVVLDSQDSSSSIVGDQRELLNSVLDTLTKSTHLVLLHHKLIWMYGNDALETQASSIANGGLGDCFNCINPNNFNSEIYPNLVTVKENGIEVICIAGDIGFNAKEFEYRTPEGIHFLASGIKSDAEGNKALIFKHNQTESILTWEFKNLNEL